MKDWCLHNGDKLMVSILLLIALGILIHVSHDKAADATVIETIKSVVNNMTGLLAGLVGGPSLRRMIQGRSTDERTAQNIP